MSKREGMTASGDRKNGHDDSPQLKGQMTTNMRIRRNPKIFDESGQ